MNGLRAEEKLDILQVPENHLENRKPEKVIHYDSKQFISKITDIFYNTTTLK